jgi:hypothetical protein
LDSRGTPGPGRKGACVSCPGWTGESSISPFATLPGAWAVNDPSATNVVQIVISGTKRRTPESAISMPAFGNAYSDAEIAAVANYVAARFSNKTRKLTQFLTHFHICKEIRLHVLACLMNEVTRFELKGRKVIALGDIAAGECARHNIEHIAVCHPSRRGYTNEKNAIEIAEAIGALSFRGVVKETGRQGD